MQLHEACCLVFLCKFCYDVLDFTRNVRLCQR
jgi:hypothetical protein